MIFGGTAVLRVDKSNIQNVLVKIPMQNSFQVTAIMIELKGLMNGP